MKKSHLGFFQIFTFLGTLTFAVACNRRPADFEQRLLKHLQSHNGIDANELDDVIADGIREIEIQTRNGNLKNAAFIPMLQHLKSDHAMAVARFKDLQSPQDGSVLETLDAHTLSNAIGVAEGDWLSATQRFCADFQGRHPSEMDFWDALQNDDPNIVDRFSNSNAENWSFELEMLKSEITDEALQMAHFLCDISKTIVCWPIDTLVLLNIKNSNVMEAGEEVGIGLKVIQELPGIHPEFAGTGRIVVNPGGTTATLYIQTSEGMIPMGQNEAEIPYTSKALVPKADGSITELHNEGKIKIRRPCKAR